MPRLFATLIIFFSSTLFCQAAIFDTGPASYGEKTPTITTDQVSGISNRSSFNVDFSAMNSWDEEFDASNETPTIDIASLAGMTPGTPVTVIGMGWDLNLEVQGFSWFSESVIKFGDDLATPTLFLQPGEGDDFGSPTPMNYNSGGIMNFGDNGLQDLVLSDGVVELELYELLDDVPDQIDATYLANSTLTFDLEMTGVSGDFDMNGLYECADVDRLVGEIVDGTNAAQFDITGDGLVDNVDLSAWLAEAGAANLNSGNPYLPPDMNLDGFVDGLDFIVWNSNKFTTTAEFCAGDVNADGFVDGIDFIVWNEFKFTQSDGVAAVPEPAFGGCLLLLGLIAFRRRR